MIDRRPELGASGHWFAGLRRIGKTSLLREIDRRCGTPGAATLPLFWDFQGLSDHDDLLSSLIDSLYDAEEALEALGLSVEQVETGAPVELVQSLVGRLRRSSGAGSSGMGSLVLLCDELDELLSLPPDALETVAEVWRRVLASPDGQIIACSSVRLADRAASDERLADLLAPLGPPGWLGALSEAESVDLLRGASSDRPQPSTVDIGWERAIWTQTGGQPMLLQMLGKRYVEFGDLDAAGREIESERTLEHLFSVDLDLLSRTEAAALRRLAEAAEPMAPERLGLGADHRDRLCALGLITASSEDSVGHRNRLFEAWLRRS